MKTKFTLHKNLNIFSKIFLKYLTILLIFLIMTLPLLVISYNFAKNIILDKNKTKLEEGVTRIENEILRMQEIADLLLSEKDYMNLMLLKGFPQPKNYFEMNTIQKKLNKLCATQSLNSMVSIIFRDNPIYISNNFSSDTYENLSPYFSKDSDPASIKKWHDNMFSKNFTLKLISSNSDYNKYLNAKQTKGITCLINNSHYSNISTISILSFSFEQEYLIEALLDKEQLPYSFTYITNANNEIIFSHEYSSNLPFPNLNSNDILLLDNEKYIVLKSRTTDLGLSAVTGISLKMFDQNVSSMINVVFLYGICGVLLITIYALYFSFKETTSFRKLLSVLPNSRTPIPQNTYKCIDSAIQKIHDINEEQLKAIEDLDHSIKLRILENLFKLGIYSNKEENEVIKYFNKKFDFFCVAIIHYYSEENEQFQLSIYHSIIIELKEILKNKISYQNYSLDINVNEVAFIIFFDDTDSCNIDILREYLLDTIQSIKNNDLPTLSFNVGLSRIVSGIKNVRTAYLQAKDALNLNTNQNKNDVYIYDIPRNITRKKIIDIAMLTKFYDFILNCDKDSISQIFHSISVNITKIHIGEQEKQQIFYSLRQTLFNAYLEIPAEKWDDNKLIFPEYVSIKDFNILILELNDFAMKLCDTIEGIKKINNERLKNDVLIYIEDHFFETNLTAATIASELNISEKYVFNIVKDKTNKSLGKLIEDYRINKAEKLLSTTDLSNTRIAQACGFGSDDTFYRAFSKKHGITPNQWKKSLNVM